jgi:hypothetical protein
MRIRPLSNQAGRINNLLLMNGQNVYQEAIMKVLSTLIVAAAMLSGCISSSEPPPPAKNTTVVVPPSSGTTVICQDGSKPPC